GLPEFLSDRGGAVIRFIDHNSTVDHEPYSTGRSPLGHQGFSLASKRIYSGIDTRGFTRCGRQIKGLRPTPASDAFRQHLLPRERFVAPELSEKTFEIRRIAHCVFPEIRFRDLLA